MKKINHSGRWLSTSLAVLVLGACGNALAAEAEAEEQVAGSSGPIEVADSSGPIEEVVVIGRYRAAATDVLSERIEEDVPMDFLDSEAISRAGDSDVAAALRRMPGLTVAKGSFVYIRGLGERYSSTQLNGAKVPSPDLTRNVLPLDIFPASVIDSLAVAKGFSPNLPAAFGGGNIDIRTTSLPEDRVLDFKIASGWTNNHSDDGVTYNGGGDDWRGEDDGTRKQSRTLQEGVDFFLGDLSAPNIQRRLAGEGVNVTLDEAAQVNRDLAKELYRDLNVQDKDLEPDYEASGSAGYRWFFGESWEVGALAYGEYERKWRNLDRENRLVSNPDTDFSNTQRTVDAVNITGSLSGGVRFTDDHDINGLYLYLRNTDDDTSVTNGCKQGQFNDCGDSDPSQSRIVRYRYEERELVVRQLHGSHTLGDATLALLPEWLQWTEVVRDTKVNWFYSDSETRTDLPSEVAINGVESIDPDTGATFDSAVQASGSALDYRYSKLHDEVEDYGASIMVPLTWRDFDAELSGGYDHYKKGRSYRQNTFGLGSTRLPFDLIRFDSPDNVFSDENLDTGLYGLELLPGIGGFGTESYGAAEKITANYLKADILWRDTWRLSGGARWEEFQQVSVPIDYLIFGAPRIPLSDEDLANSITKEDDWYPAVALTYIRPGFLAEEFQFRLGWSETVARPDLREVSASTYIDPLTEARVRGNPLLETSDLTNYDARAEWFWDSGDSFSISAFYKDIDDPIETVQGGATEDNVLFNFVNADTAEVYGVELEGLKSLGFMDDWVGGWIEAFYLSGNLTLSDSEIEIPPTGGVGNITNDKRAMTQQSDWVVNVQLGYDSFNGRHSANVVYNAFGERIFFAGIDGFDDAKEQPFHSIDFVYSYFPTEEVTVKLRLKNLLDEEITIEQDNVDILEQEIGVQYLLDISWEL